MKGTTEELSEREAQLESEIKTLHEQLATWRNDTPKAIKDNYPTRYALYQSILQREVERRMLARPSQLDQQE